MSEAPVRCVLVGAGGQLAHDLARTFDLGGELVALRRRDLDLLDAARVEETLRALRPTHVVNGAAYNHVDRAEDEPAQAFALNAEAVGTLAAACQALGATLAHFSTDYVFDGRQRRPYREDDAPNPLGVYAESKLAGERLARERCARAFVFRVCGLFGVGRPEDRPHFVETMLRLARAGRPLRVVRDQVVGPSYTLDVAAKVWRVLARGRPGLYHLTNAGETSWYDFARAIVGRAGLAPDLTPVTAAEFGARARRPAYSVLAHTALAALGEDDLRPWPEALAAYLDER
ncbi:MAG TPA: dTDP-4-dehydrorhamnose reductase, partial [Methylomirabilota bacterium]|nr:dTDP-4-dehydrorhamnose reductase [Methylomirabilota bacterium]